MSEHDRLIRLPEAQVLLGGICASTFKKLVAEGTIPPGQRLPGTGAHSGGPFWWRESDIRAANAAILRKREASIRAKLAAVRREASHARTAR